MKKNNMNEDEIFFENLDKKIFNLLFSQDIDKKIIELINKNYNDEEIVQLLKNNYTNIKIRLFNIRSFLNNNL